MSNPTDDQCNAIAADISIVKLFFMDAIHIVNEVETSPSLSQHFEVTSFLFVVP